MNRNRDHAMARLASARIRVSGPHEAASLLIRDLCESGIVDVRLADGAPSDLAVVITVDKDERHPDQTAELLRQGTRAYLLRVGARAAQVGPLLMADMTSCYACHIRQYPHPVGSASPLFVRMACGLAALQIFHAVSQVGAGTLHTSFRVLSADEDGAWSQDARLATRTPGCAGCGLGGGRITATDPRAIAWIYHGATSFPVGDLIGPKGHQGHYSVANMRLASNKSRASSPVGSSCSRRLSQHVAQPRRYRVPCRRLVAVRTSST